MERATRLRCWLAFLLLVAACRNYAGEGSALVPPCGDGELSPDEGCDDGNTISGDGCDANCKPTGCGNGVKTAGEGCDDGNTIDGDGCNADCSLPGCGNSAINDGEQCDDGNTIDGDGCDADCTITGCGNGVITEGEQCDDANSIDGDGCDTNCTRTRCGNGETSDGEQCDDGNTVDGDGCDSNCTETACGNGIVTDGEQCDDGNHIDLDGCGNECLVTLPGLLYYRFDEAGTTVTNHAAAPPPGASVATLHGAMSQSSGGVCGGALIGTGASSGADYLDTHWKTALTGTSWTLAFWADHIRASSTLFHAFGDPTAGSFRCFTNGAAGTGNWLVRGGGLTDVVVPGAAVNAMTMTTLVYNAATSDVRAYRDGVLVSVVLQGPLHLTGTGTFKIGGYGSSTGLPARGTIDELRLYNRALSDAEVTELFEITSTCPFSP